MVTIRPQRRSASRQPATFRGAVGRGPDSYFTGVPAVAATDVWAVGVVGSGPIILHWDGEAWATVTHPRAFPNSAVLRAVTTSSDGSAWSTLSVPAREAAARCVKFPREGAQVGVAAGLQGAGPSHEGALDWIERRGSMPRVILRSGT